MTQIQPEMMIVHLRPMRSASLETARAPTNEPAGIAATMAPWALAPGFPKVVLYALLERTPDMDEMSRPNSPPPMHAKEPTMYCEARCDEGQSGTRTTPLWRRRQDASRRTGFDAMAALYCGVGREVSPGAYG